MSIDELRIEKLKKWKNQRIRIRGIFIKWGTFTEYQTRRDIPTAMLRGVECDSEVVADHIWVQHSDPMKEKGVQPGDLVECSVLVFGFPRRLDEKTADGKYVIEDYSCKYPQDITLPGKACVAIPEEREITPQEQMARVAHRGLDIGIPPDEVDVEEVKPAVNPVKHIKAVKEYMKMVGGQSELGTAAEYYKAVGRKALALAAALGSWEAVEEIIDALE